MGLLMLTWVKATEKVGFVPEPPDVPVPPNVETIPLFLITRIRKSPIVVIYKFPEESPQRPTGILNEAEATARPSPAYAFPPEPPTH
jgi:hypothetical protein